MAGINESFLNFILTSIKLIHSVLGSVHGTQRCLVMQLLWILTITCAPQCFYFPVLQQLLHCLLSFHFGACPSLLLNSELVKGERTITDWTVYSPNSYAEVETLLSQNVAICGGEALHEVVKSDWTLIQSDWYPSKEKFRTYREAPGLWVHKGKGML